MLSELFLRQSKGKLFHVVAARWEKRLAATAFVGRRRKRRVLWSPVDAEAKASPTSLGLQSSRPCRYLNDVTRSARVLLLVKERAWRWWNLSLKDKLLSPSIFFTEFPLNTLNSSNVSFESWVPYWRAVA